MIVDCHNTSNSSIPPGEEEGGGGGRQVWNISSQRTCHENRNDSFERASTEHGSVAITVFPSRLQNCGSMRAEACFDRVNTPRIVSFSKARMFHESRSSAIPFYLLDSKFRGDTTTQRSRTSYLRSSFFNNISPRPPLPSLPPLPLLVAITPHREIEKFEWSTEEGLRGSDKILFRLCRSAKLEFHRFDYANFSNPFACLIRYNNNEWKGSRSDYLF